MVRSVALGEVVQKEYTGKEWSGVLTALAQEVELYEGQCWG